MQSLLISPRAILISLRRGPSVPLNLAPAEVAELRPWPCHCCPFILIRSAKRPTEVVDDMKRVDGDLTVHNARRKQASKESLKKSDSKLTECGNQPIDVTQEYGYKSWHGCRARIHGRQSCWWLPAILRSPLISKYLEVVRVLMASIVCAWPVLALLGCWWTLWETGCGARGILALNRSCNFDDYSWTVWPLSFS